MCGPPLTATGSTPTGRRKCLSIADALGSESEGDAVVVFGMVTVAPTVTIEENITLRGPTSAEATPDTHLGFLQAAETKPPDNCTSPGPVVTIQANAKVTIEDLNIRHGRSTDGGGIKVESGGTLNLKRSTVYDNRAHNGGGVYNAGTLEVADATLSGNAGDNGGGVFNAPGASLTLRRSTLHANTASDGGQSIANEGTATVEGSILATSGTRDQCSGNTFANAGPNPPVRNLVWGPGCSQSESLAGNVDPRLGTLRDNGGATLTHASQRIARPSTGASVRKTLRAWGRPTSGAGRGRSTRWGRRRCPSRTPAPATSARMSMARGR